MPLTPEQIKELKNQLHQQIEHLPEDQKAQARQQIDSMSDEAIEAMLEQQKTSQKPIFRAIVAGEVPSRQIDQNKEAIAVLDIKPISKGHTIIIPKKAVEKSEDIPNETFALAKEVAARIKSELKAKGAEIQTQFSFGEIIINLIPIYDKPLSINSPRTESNEKELDEIYFKLKKKEKPETIKIEKPKQEEIIKLKRKVP